MDELKEKIAALNRNINRLTQVVDDKDGIISEKISSLESS